ncbi:hypothetical protein V8C86DRAFT_31689 [Haematococcus lacustris]
MCDCLPSLLLQSPQGLPRTTTTNPLNTTIATATTTIFITAATTTITIAIAIVTATIAITTATATVGSISKTPLHTKSSSGKSGCVCGGSGARNHLRWGVPSKGLAGRRQRGWAGAQQPWCNACRPQRCMEHSRESGGKVTGVWPIGKQAVGMRYLGWQGRQAVWQAFACSANDCDLPCANKTRMSGVIWFMTAERVHTPTN